MIDKLLADTALHTCDLSISNVVKDAWMGLRDIQQTPKFSVSEPSYMICTTNTELNTN